MSELLVVKNITREGPGMLANVLTENGIAFDVVDLDAGDVFPPPSQYHAIVVLGGPDSANDDTPKMVNELEQIKEALDDGVPYLGICLGLQALIKAAGGNVVRAENKEIGFVDPDGSQYNIQVTDEGKSSPLLAGLPDNLDVFHLHGETVTLTDTMKLLGIGKHCRNQIVQVTDTAYGIQSHFELTPDMLITWAEQDADLIPITKEKLLADYGAIQAAYTTIGKTLLRNFLVIAKLLWPSAKVHIPQLSSIFRLGTDKKDLGEVNFNNMVELAEYCPPRPQVYLS